MIKQENQIFQFNGSPITFQKGDSVMVNATQMAKHFSKEPKFWLSNQSTRDYINELSEVRNLTSADLVVVIKGGDPVRQGTWMHEDVALEFARWLSPAFAIWCNDRIKELLKQGVATVSNDDATIANAISILQKRLQVAEQQSQIAQGTIEHQEQEIKVLAPKAQYADEVLQSTSTFTATQIAKSIGMSALTFNKRLQEKGILFRQSGQWFLTHKHQNKGYTEMRVSKYIDRKTEEVKTCQSLVWTERGRAFIHEIFNGEGGAL